MTASMLYRLSPSTSGGAGTVNRGAASHQFALRPQFNPNMKIGEVPIAGSAIYTGLKPPDVQFFVNDL